MITLYEKKTGKPVSVPDEQARAALESGQYGFAGPVSVISPEGEAGTVPVESLRDALSQNYRLETDEEARLRERGVSQFEQKALGVGLPAASAATFGLSDGLLDKLVDVNARLEQNPNVLNEQTFRKLREDIAKAQPAAGVVGEVTGLTAGLLGGGVPALVSEGGRGVTQALAGRVGPVAARALGEAAEGAAYGLGQFVRDSQVDENPNLSAEKLLTLVGVGGGVGALTGAAAGGLSKASKWASGKVAAGGVDDWLKGLSEAGAITQYAKKSDLKRLGLLEEEELRKVGRQGLDEKLLGLRPEDTLQRAGAARLAVGEQINEVLDRSAKGFEIDAHKLSAEMQKVLTSMEVKPGEVSPFLQETHAKLAGLLEDFQKLQPPGQRSGLSFRKAWDMQTQMLHATSFGQSRAEAAPWLAKMRKAFRDETLRQLDEAVPGMEGLMRNLTTRYRTASIFEDLAEGALTSKLGNRWLGMSEMLHGVAGFAAGGPAGGFVMAGGRKLWEVYGKGAAVLAGNRLAKTQVLGRAAGGFLNFVEKGLESGPTWGGVFRANLANASALGADSLFEEHVRLANTSPEYLTTLGLTPDTPEQFQEAMARSANLDALSDSIGSVDSRVHSAMDRFLGQAKQEGEAVRLDAKQLAEMKEHLEAFINDPQPNKELLEMDATLAGLVTLKQQAAAQYLLSTMPRRPDPQLLRHLENQWEPSPLELARFSRVVQAVQRPEAVIENLLKNRQSSEQMEVLRRVYPELLAETRLKMMERIAGIGKPLNYRQKLALSVFMGAPVGGAGTRIDLIQQMRQQAAQQEQPSGSRPDGRQVVDSAKNLETQDQRIQARGGLP